MVSTFAGQVRVASHRTKPFATTVTVCRALWYSRTNTVPGLRRRGRSAGGLAPRVKLARCLTVFGSSSINASSWMGQQRNRFEKRSARQRAGQVRNYNNAEGREAQWG